MKRACEHFEQLLYDKGMKGLSLFDKMRVKTHIAHCEECRRHYLFEMGLNDLFAGARIYDCPSDVREVIRRRTAGVDRTVQTLSRLFAIRKYTYAAAAVAAVAIMFMLNPFSGVRQEMNPSFTDEQIALARKQAEWSLAYTGSLLNKTNMNAVENVLLEKVPESLRASLEKSLSIF